MITIIFLVGAFVLHWWGFSWLMLLIVLIIDGLNSTLT